MAIGNAYSHRETLVYATYYAPRGRGRLYRVAAELSQRYLTPTDLLIGILGAEGSGKSTLIKGLFPGLELTNDDDGVNLRSTPLFDFDPKDPFSGHTFHIDARYELAFKQPFEICDAIQNALDHGRRVICEHFDLLYGTLGYNAHLLIGIGEEIIVARPTIFGPFPARIKTRVDNTVKYRFMAHTAEDIASRVLEKEYHYTRPVLHSDVRHGFVINFQEKPDFDLDALEAKIQAIIRDDVAVCPVGEDSIRIGDEPMACTGVRTHVKSTGDIENFRLLKKLIFEPHTREWLLIGMVGPRENHHYQDLIDIADIEQQP